MQLISIRLVGAGLAGMLLCSCAVVEFGGKVARKAGETLTGYSKENDGVTGKAAGVAGGVYTTAGTVAEDSAKSGKGEPAGQSTTTRKQTASAAGAQDNVVSKAQKRLKELGYDAGTPDGVLGARTTDAIGQFQASRGLRVTKTLDQPTLSALGISGTS
jgi:peptidoglycan hydrolase-like protein with peptidoglycan-binding domain